MTSIRVLTYNVRSLRDDGAAVVRVIRELAPDVACIQEAPRFLRWRAKCKSLARDVGMSWVSGGREAAANLLLAAPAVAAEATRSALFSKDARLERRGVAMALFCKGKARFAVAGTHLDGVEAPRLRHITELHQAVDGFVAGRGPVIIAGDVNDIPGSRSWAALLTRGADAFAIAGTGVGETSNVALRTRRIDAVFAGGDITVVTAMVPDSADVRIASDHYPVISDLQLPD